MKLKDFLDDLRKTPRDWELLKNRQIQRVGPNGRKCPWLAVDDLHSDWNYVGYSFGAAFCHRVANAADNLPDHDPVLRAQLLEACGLKEPTC